MISTLPERGIWLDDIYVHRNSNQSRCHVRDIEKNENTMLVGVWSSLQIWICSGPHKKRWLSNYFRSGSIQFIVFFPNPPVSSHIAKCHLRFENQALDFMPPKNRKLTVRDVFSHSQIRHKFMRLGYWMQSRFVHVIKQSYLIEIIRGQLKLQAFPSDNCTRNNFVLSYWLCTVLVHNV